MPVKLHVDRLHEFAKLTRGRSLQYLEACVWCMSRWEHGISAEVSVRENGKGTRYAVYWDTDLIDIEAIERSYNQEDALPKGAEAIALCVSIEKTDCNIARRSVRGEGIDWWLGQADSNPNHIFHDKYRLEVSGILKEGGSNTIASRVKEKLAQTSPTDHTLPVCVIVVEFHKLVAQMVWKNAYS